MRRRKRDSIPSKYILSIISILCIGFMLLSYVFGFQGGPLGTISGYLFVPIQKGINYVGGYLSDRADNLQDLRMVMAERDALQEQVITCDGKTLQGGLNVVISHKRGSVIVKYLKI